MILYNDEQTIKQVEPRKGGYCYLQVPGSMVNSFKDKKATRLVCTIDNRLTFQCGLNHLGDGNFFIIISSKNLKLLGKRVDDSAAFVLTEDPDPLGAPMPDSLLALLEQDEAFKALFDELSMGKKRFVIHAISRIKDLDKQVATAIKMIPDPSSLRPPKKA